MTRARAAEICQYIKFILKNEDYTEEVEKALNMAIEALEQDLVLCSDCKFNKQCDLQHYWTVDGFTEEIEYCSLGKRSEE